MKIIVKDNSIMINNRWVIDRWLRVWDEKLEGELPDYIQELIEFIKLVKQTKNETKI